MGVYNVILTEEEEKALLTDIASVQDWLNNAIHNKARQCIDKVVEQYSDKQPKKLTEVEKYKIVRETNVKSAADRQRELEARTL